MNPISQQKIEAILYPYVQINSQSGTSAENLAGAYFHQHFAAQPYFQAHPEHFGSYAVQGDPHQRKVEWALVQGTASPAGSLRTVVLLHHFDVVEIEDYGLLKPYAFQPANLEAALLRQADGLPPEARQDLLGGGYLFGRGTADMKGGGSVQMAIVDAFSQSPEALPGCLLLIGVPDEENLSAGMRSAAGLLAELKDRLGLEYVLMINCEPHQRKDPARGVLSGGSIGKLMPFVYVRGVLAHAGKSPEGFNPLAILSDVVRRTEMSLDLTETQPAAGEMTPPPTWLMARDSKAVYDVSMPLSAFGFLSVLTLTNHPGRVLASLEQVCRTAAAELAAQANRSADAYHRATGRPPLRQPWQPQVLSFAGYLEWLRASQGAGFEAAYAQICADASAALSRSELTTAAATWRILDGLAQLSAPSQPLVLVGLLPPYYPAVCYLDRPDFSAAIQRQTETLNRLTQARWGQAYELEAYFTGISDLSYSSLSAAPQVEQAISLNMPLYGADYQIPFRQISAISMPCINIGPWGKDFHKLTERVLKEDLFERTPAMVLAAIQTALELP